MVLETLEFGWEKKTNIYTYAIRWPRVPGKFFYHVLGHPVNSLNKHLCDKNKVSIPLKKKVKESAWQRFLFNLLLS